MSEPLDRRETAYQAGYARGFQAGVEAAERIYQASREIALVPPSQDATRCETCRGTGELSVGAMCVDPCWSCGGTGRAK